MANVSGDGATSRRAIVPLLRQAPLFRDLSEADLRAVAEIAQVVRSPRRHYLFRRDDPGDAMFVIVSGLVKITQFSSRKVKTLAILGPGEVFGEMALLTEGMRSAAAVVQEETETVVLRKPAFMALLRENFAITARILHTLCRRLVSADHDIEDMTFKNIEGRVVSKLLQLAERFGAKEERGTIINLDLTHQELADLVGTNRETVSHKIAEFRREGSLGVTVNKRFVILNEEVLRAWMR